MAKVTLQALEGIESITIQTTDGKTVRLAHGQPAVVADDDTNLIAAVRRIPASLEPEPKPGLGDDR